MSYYQTPQMYLLSIRICELQLRFMQDPNDFMLEFELDEAAIKYAKLATIERLGLRLVQGGRQMTKARTAYKRLSS